MKVEASVVSHSTAGEDRYTDPPPLPGGFVLRPLEHPSWRFFFMGLDASRVQISPFRRVSEVP